MGHAGAVADDIEALGAGLQLLQDAPELFQGLPQGRVVQQVPQDLLPQAYGLPVVRQQAESEFQGFPRAEAGKEQLAQARQLQY